MPLQKILLKPGVNRENTRYTNEGGWFESDKIRFRQGTPEKIGGWTQYAGGVFTGVCRSLWNWITLASQNLVGVGTNLRFYIEQGGSFYDITPVRETVVLTNPFGTTDTSTTVIVTDAAHGCGTGDTVIFSGGTAVGGITISGEYVVSVTGLNTYTITAASPATSTATGGGTVTTQYLTNIGPPYQIPQVGWGAGAWGAGTWGVGDTSNTASLQIWNQYNFGQNLLFGPRGGGIYYWDAEVGIAPIQITITIASPGVVTIPTGFTFLNGTVLQLTTSGALPTGLSVGTVYFVVNSTGTTFNLATSAGGTPIVTSGSQSGTQFVSPRGINLASIGGAYTPVIQNYIIVSDASRFVIVFGTNDPNAEDPNAIDPMLIRWSQQEDPFVWEPLATNQAGSARLSHGSKIITAIQTRQEIVVFTDQALYSLQYLGPPFVWGTQLLGDNISIIGPNAATLASGIVYWMGRDKFYIYDGRVQTLNCDLRKYIFQDIDAQQNEQICCGTNEGFNEVWWFYCSLGSTEINKYVVYNYVENVWYYGSMARTAWLDTGLSDYPIAATYNYKLVQHEDGTDDNETGTPVAFESFISSAEFDIGDGHNFAFVWRVLPDLTFAGSSAGASPEMTMTLYPMQNSGSGTGVPAAAAIDKLTGVEYLITEGFTGQIYTRLRGRQMILKVSSSTLGTAWQLGAPRIDIRQDGRR
jgi:hypothetical protein